MIKFFFKNLGEPMIDITEIYCFSDNIIKLIDGNSNKKRVGRPAELSQSEYVTLAILQQKMGIKTKKALHNLVKEFMGKEFPKVPSYQQFCDGMSSTLEYFVFISWVLSSMARKNDSEYYVVDSTPLTACNNNYRYRSKIFKGLASSGKNMNGHFFGFKLHIIINNNMEIVSLKITGGAANDLTTLLDENFIKDIQGWLVGDKGYVGKEKREKLLKKGVRLVTKFKKGMKKLPAKKHDNFLLTMRQSVESVFSYIKHHLSAIYKYARSAESYFVSVFSAIVIYMLEKHENKGFFTELIS